MPGHPALSDYFQELLDTTAKYSYRVTASDASTQYPSIDIRWPDDNATAEPLRGNGHLDLKASASGAFEALTRSWATRKAERLCAPIPAGAERVYDTSLRPVLQMGPFSIAQETDIVVPTIFRTGNSLATAPGGQDTTIDWTSGYFSVQPRYRQLVLDSKSAVRIVTAHPEVRLRRCLRQTLV